MGAAQPNRQIAEKSFGQPNFRPESLPGLTATLEAFAEYLAEEGGKLLGGPFTCAVEGIDQARLFEALEASQGLPMAILFSPELNAQAFLIFDAQFGWALIDSVFSRASMSETDERRRRPTPRATRVGERFIREVAEMAATSLTRAFSLITTANFEVQRMETTSEAPPSKRHDAPMLTAGLAVKAFAGEGRVVLIFPQATIGRLRHDLSVPRKAEMEMEDPGWNRDLSNALSSAPIEITAVMEELQMTLEEVSKFSIGTVIALHGSGMGRVRLMSNGQELFWCRMAHSSDRYELEIE